MPAALTLILTCPSPGSVSGTPAHFSTSGGPYPVITTAFGMAVPSFLVAAAVWPRTVTSAWSLCAVPRSLDRAVRRRRLGLPGRSATCGRAVGGDRIDSGRRHGADGRSSAAKQAQRTQGG